VTPAEYITAIITENGICYPPFIQSLSNVVQASGYPFR
jgi:methylthioribose-1-phosphate isomerase